MTTTRVVIPRGATREEALKIMFDADPTCRQCEKPIEKLEYANAIEITVKGQTFGYKLVHKSLCSVNAILASNPNTITRGLRTARRYE
jgi:hypothetical protein